MKNIIKQFLILLFTLSLLFTLGCSIVGLNENDNNMNEMPKENESEHEDNKTEPDADEKKDNEDNKELFDEYEDIALKTLEELSIEEKVGQIFLVRCPLPEDLDYFMSMKPGGFILFGRDFVDKTKDDVIKDIESYQNKSKIPMIIGVDEEGGTVVRVSSNYMLADERFKSPQELYNIGGFEEIKNDTYTKSNLLLDLGINLNLAPVADVSENKTDFIYQRAFGKSAEETSKYVNIVVEAMKESGISGTLKHFPGYGNNVDTHTGSAYDNRPYSNFKNNDFLPFSAGIETGVESILVSHNIIESMDTELPASLSKEVINILRNELNFTGVIMTDDLSMGAITNLQLSKSPEVVALLAGNDMLIVTDYETSYNAILNAVKNEEISMDRLNESVLRILKWKYYMEIM